MAAPATLCPKRWHSHCTHSRPAASNESPLSSTRSLHHAFSSVIKTAAGCTSWAGMVRDKRSTLGRCPALAAFAGSPAGTIVWAPSTNTAAFLQLKAFPITDLISLGGAAQRLATPDGRSARQGGDRGRRQPRGRWDVALKRSAAAPLAQLIAAAAPPPPLPCATAISSHPSHPLLPPQEPVWRELSAAREPPCT